MRNKSLRLFLSVLLSVVYIAVAQAQGYADRLMAQGNQYMSSYRLGEAYKCFEDAAGTYQAEGNMAGYCQATGMMGTLNEQLGEWETAERQYDEVLHLASQSRDYGLMAQMLVAKVKLYKDVDDIEGCNAALSALDSIEAVSGNPMVKWQYHLFWSDECTRHHELSMAEYHLEQCGKVVDLLPLAMRSPAMVRYLYLMSFAKSYQYDFAGAIDYAKQLVEYSRKQFQGSEQVYTKYTSLALNYGMAGDRKNMEACIDSLGKGFGHSGQDKGFLAQYYEIVGCCYQNLNDYATAAKWFDKAYDTLGDRDVAEEPVKYSALMLRLRARMRLHHYGEACPLAKEYAEATKRKFGHNSVNYFTQLSRLATIEAKCGNTAEAVRLFKESVDFLFPYYKRQWKLSTTYTREGYSDWQEAMASLAAFAVDCGMTQNEIVEGCYDALLFSKSTLLDSDRSLRDILHTDASEEDVARYSRLMALGTRMAALGKNYNYNRREIDSLNVIIRDIDRQLTDMCKTYRDYSAFLDKGYGDIRAMLKDDEVLLDFTEYNSEVEEDVNGKELNSGDRQYAAYVIGHGQEHPLLAGLFKQWQVDSLVGGRPVDNLYRGATGMKAYETVWQPLEKYIKKGATVYYVPVGRLHQMALESLPCGDGTVVGDHYHFVRLTSARELGRRRSLPHAGGMARLYGGLKYTVEADTMMAESKRYSLPEMYAMRGVVRGDSIFGELPYSSREVRTIAEVLRHGGYKVKVMSGNGGTEESFVSMSGASPTILHLATHGFYYTPSQAHGVGYLDGYTDAMSLSGIVFAGANAAWQGKAVPEGVMDGIMTANDIARLDLGKTSLVVLSACQTGQGVATPEGLYGLQRAFKKAGAGTIVMSMWSVSDKVTSEFMTLFYKNMTFNGWDRRKAFDKAKADIRLRYPEPFYWAAFVMLD